MINTRIKICGITSPGDAREVIAAGADALGLVFYPPSPRAVSIEQARQILAEAPPFVSVVALLVNETAEAVRRLLAELPVDMIQFHGDESAEFCEQFQRPYMKALRVREGMDVSAAVHKYASARAVLLDSWQEGVPGGTGKTFDWRLAELVSTVPVVLAGGLNPQNVGGAVEQLQPAAVDVSGGVESAPGVKDPVQIREFIRAVKAADQRLSGQ